MPYKGFGWNYEIFFFLKDHYQSDSCKLVSGLYTFLSVLSEEKANGRIWNVIEKCISLDADNRYTSKELIEQLDILMR